MTPVTILLCIGVFNPFTKPLPTKKINQLNKHGLEYVIT